MGEDGNRGRWYAYQNFLREVVATRTKARWLAWTGYLVAAGAVPPRDVLSVGLTILSVLAELCRSEPPSVLQRVA